MLWKTDPGEGASFDAKIMVEGVQRIRKAIKETEDKTEETCKQFLEYDYLLTIPGFGPDVSAKVLGALGNFHRFSNHKQVLKTAGLNLSANSSGKISQVSVPIIFKQEKADLRYALYQAAFVAACRNKALCSILQNNCKVGKKKKTSRPNVT